jgi:hypothetical protein
MRPVMYHTTSPRQYEFDFCPWLFWGQAGAEMQQAQLDWQAALAEAGGVAFGERCFVSPLAGVYPERLSLGADSYIAAYAYVTGALTAGAHCSVNPYAVVEAPPSAIGPGVSTGPSLGSDPNPRRTSSVLRRGGSGSRRKPRAGRG